MGMRTIQESADHYGNSKREKMVIGDRNFLPIMRVVSKKLMRSKTGQVIKCWCSCLYIVQSPNSIT